MNLVWLPLALHLRFAPLEHVAKQNSQAAVQLDEQIEAQADLLTTYPEMGRIGRQVGTRELVVQRTPCILVYRVRPQAKRVEILRVLHGAQQWPLPKAK
ncbi:MAG: type II toxin-antitoxin system RelE/ParE family toxin [Pseudomonadota bacterium]|nr:type II toxin-antitoxin system RelE/ParE family toxin [Pseudomonadota bacterium]